MVVLHLALWWSQQHAREGPSMYWTDSRLYEKQGHVHYCLTAYV